MHRVLCALSTILDNVHSCQSKDSRLSAETLDYQNELSRVHCCSCWASSWTKPVQSSVFCHPLSQRYPLPLPTTGLRRRCSKPLDPSMTFFRSSTPLLREDPLESMSLASLGPCALFGKDQFWRRSLGQYIKNALFTMSIKTIAT